VPHAPVGAARTEDQPISIRSIDARKGYPDCGYTELLEGHAREENRP